MVQGVPEDAAGGGDGGAAAGAAQGGGSLGDGGFAAIDFSRGSSWMTGEGEASDVVVSSRVRLARNLAGHTFMPRATQDERHEVLLVCRRVIARAWRPDGSETIRGGVPDRVAWMDLHRTPPLERTLLVERHLISKPHAKGKLSSGRGGPLEPRAVAVVTPGERVSVMVNEEDHLRIQAVAGGLDLRGALAAADAADDRIEAHADYAFSSRFGYLTACPTNVGTGIRLSVMMHLPALKQSGSIDKVKRAADDLGLVVRGFYGEGSQSAGDLYQLSNQVTLGKSEQILLQELEGEVVPNVVAWERQERRKLCDARRLVTSDTAHRALGLLRSARIMGTDEAMKLLSRVRLGVVTGLIEGLTVGAVNELLVLIHPAHLQRMAGREMNQAERQEARAEFVRGRLESGRAA